MTLPSADQVDDWDPMHRASGPDAYWTTSNAGEAFPGVVTPLSWSFIGDVVEVVLRRPAYQVGALARSERAVPAGGQDRFIQAFFGRAALQVDYFALLGDRLPGATGREIVTNYLGQVPDGMRFHPTRRRYPIVAVRFPWCFVTSPRQVRRLAAEMDEWYPRRIAEVPDQDLTGALDLFVDAHRYFSRAAVMQGLVVFAHVQPLYAGLAQLVDKAGLGDIGALSGAFGIETGELVTDLWDVSRGRLPLEHVAARHGYHGPMEGEMSSRVWREDAAPLRRMIAEYANRDDSEDPRLRQQARVQARGDAVREVLDALPGRQRPAARLLLGLAARAMPLRGIAKAAFLQAIDVARASARRAGEHLVDHGVLRQTDDVFYLTVDELTGHLTPEIQELVERRQARRAAYLQLDVPPYWKGMPEPIRMTARTRTVDAGDVLDGIGVSPGVVDGIARVVLDPDFMDVEPGEILVAPITDPSWSSIMFISKALVVDLGGALSHAAVVARELGLPCVVSTRDGTRVIRTGDHIRVDGVRGTVQILARAGSNNSLGRSLR